MQVETLLSNTKIKKFETRDEQEVAGYAEAMDLVFQAYDDMPLTENHKPFQDLRFNWRQQERYQSSIAGAG